MRPIIQALEFHISAVNVNPRNAGTNLGSTFGTITFPTKKTKVRESLKQKKKHFYVKECVIDNLHTP